MAGAVVHCHWPRSVAIPWRRGWRVAGVVFYPATPGMKKGRRLLAPPPRILTIIGSSVLLVDGGIEHVVPATPQDGNARSMRIVIYEYMY